MNLMLAALPILGGVYLSCRLTRRFTEREKVLRSLYGDLARLENNVCYYAVPLKEAFRRLEGENGEFFALLAKRLEEGDSGVLSALWAEGLKKERYQCLCAGERETLLDFASLLGQGEIKAQKELFFAVKKQLEGHIADAAREAERYVKMYRVLGFVSGTVLAIMVI